MFKIGQKVICNGFPGTITEICTGQLTGMVVVRLASGTVCVDASELAHFNKPVFTEGFWAVHQRKYHDHKNF
jgi:hypothetical protein